MLSRRGPAERQAEDRLDSAMQGMGPIALALVVMGRYGE
jgi:hypothetical protein